MSNSKNIITEADKGSAVVLMNKEYYERNIYKLLSDETTYMKINENMDNKIIYKIKQFSQKYSTQLTKNEINYITKFNAETSVFYGLPKIHKSTSIGNSGSVEGVVTVLEPEDLAFRPIVASTNCPTSRLSSLVDKILSPYIIYMKAYVKDTSDILKKLPKQLSEDEMLMTMDIKRLYTNISINLGLSAIKYSTEKYPQISKFQSELIWKLAILF